MSYMKFQSKEIKRLGWENESGHLRRYFFLKVIQITIHFFIRANFARATELKLLKNKKLKEHFETGKFKNTEIQITRI